MIEWEIFSPNKKSAMVKTKPTETIPSEVRGKLAKHLLVDGYDLVYDLERSRGSYLYDSLRGETFLDFFSFFATNPVGFNHPRVREEAFRRKLGDVAIHNPSNSDIYTVEMAQFVDTFGRDGEAAKLALEGWRAAGS